MTLCKVMCTLGGGGGAAEFVVQGEAFELAASLTDLAVSNAPGCGYAGARGEPVWITRRCALNLLAVVELPQGGGIAVPVPMLGNAQGGPRPLG